MKFMKYKLYFKLYNRKMKICSFDVGIINLAYCIINKDENNFSIEKWGIINIDENIITCEHIIKKNNQCKKKATYALRLGEEYKYYCSSHKKDHKELLDDFIKKSIYQSINKTKCNYIVPKSNNQCNKTASNQIDNILYCPTHFKNVCKLGKLTQLIATKKSIQDLAKTMFNKLDLIPEMLNVSEILIENQPTLINPTMKTIASLLYGYFVMRGICEKEKTKSLIENIRFICPSNKLKIEGENIVEGTIKTNDNIIDKKIKQKVKKEEYIITKSIGIKFTRALLEENKLEDSIKILENFDKKDDLCDAFLQGYHYLFSKDKEVKISDNIKKLLKNELGKATDKTNNKNKKIIIT